MATNRLPLRRLCLWISCAIPSLPVPLSPLIITEALVFATFLASSTARQKAGEMPISEAHPVVREVGGWLEGSRRDPASF